MRGSDVLGRALFAAAVLGALGFGGAQAAASPAPAAVEAACLDARCFLECRQRGFDGGACTAGGGCSCYYIAP